MTKQTKHNGFARLGDDQISVASFFSGIGGFEIGMEAAGFSTQFQCENSGFCNSVLSTRWPTVNRHGDINELDPRDIPSSSIWTGGFPCQDVSVARGGRGREGLKGKNSGLFYSFYELVEKQRPKVLFLENVLGLLNSHKGKDFHIILDLLTGLGYGVAWRILNTRYFGAPQSRTRVYILAWDGRPDLAAQSLFEETIPAHPENARHGFLRSHKCRSTGAFVPEVAYCLAATSGRHTGTDWSRTYVSYYDRVRRLTPRECEGLQGFPTDWTKISADSDSSDEEFNTMRYHALGNAVSVPAIYWIAKRIKAIYPNKTERRWPKNLKNLPHRLRGTAQEFQGPTASDLFLHDYRESTEHLRWKTGGIAYMGHVVEARVSPAPNEIIPSKLVDVLETEPVGDRYYLSPNAAEGILRRVNSQGRTLFEPLARALARLAGHDPKPITIDQNLAPSQLSL